MDYKFQIGDRINSSDGPGVITECATLEGLFTTIYTKRPNHNCYHIVFDDGRAGWRGEDCLQGPAQESSL